MVKKWPVGSLPGSGTLRLRQSTEVRVSLSAIADGVGKMGWIAAGHGPGVPLVSNAISDSGQAGDCSDDAAEEDCARGGFGETGGQFYKSEEGP